MTTLSRREGLTLLTGTEYVEQICIDPGCYTVTINDSFGDGMCCASR